jgi:hypothetical protein
VTVSQRLIPAAWDAEPQPFLGGLISEQAAQKVHQAWLQRVALARSRCWSRGYCRPERRC